MRSSRRALAAVPLAVLVAVSGPAAAPPVRNVAGRPATAPSAGAARPNFVFLLTDDLDSASIRHMPRLRRLLIERGTTLSRYFVSLPWCCPSRATMLRGQYAHNTGIWTVSPPRGGFAAFHQKGLESSTIATWLQSAGYRTGLFGKYLNGYNNAHPYGPKKRTYVPPGWDSWTVPAAGNPYSEFDYTLNTNGALERHRPAQGDYLTDVLRQRAEKFVRAADARPFFAYINTYGPHAPATPAPRHAGMFGAETAPRTPAFDERDMAGKPAALRRLPRVTEREERRWDALYRNRLRSLQAVDEMVDGLVEALRAGGRLANTYFVFTSDNGFHIGQHRLGPGKNTPYEEDVRVPFVVRGPGVPAGRTVDSLAGNVDVAPTLADLAGVGVPGYVDGRSFRPLLRPGPPPPDWRSAYLLEQSSIPGATENGGGKRENNYLPPFFAMRTSRYLYVEYKTGELELYDVIRDPHQLHNIAAQNPVTTRLSARLHRLRSCAAATCRTGEAGP